MRRLKIIMAVALLLLVVSNSHVLVVHAKNSEANAGVYQVKIIDDADLLTDSEETQLKEAMNKTADYCNALFVTANNVVSSTSDYAKTTYNREFGTKNGVLFLIDMSNREIYIYAHGVAYQTITKTNAYTITDNVYSYASGENYYECANNAFEQINVLLEGGRINRPMKYISNILLALIISVLFNFWLLKKTSKVEDLGVKNLLEGTKNTYDMEELDLKLLNHSCVSNSSSSSGGIIGGGSSDRGGFSGGSSGSSGGGSRGGGGGHSF